MIFCISDCNVACCMRPLVSTLPCREQARILKYLGMDSIASASACCKSNTFERDFTYFDERWRQPRCLSVKRLRRTSGVTDTVNDLVLCSSKQTWYGCFIRDISECARCLQLNPNVDRSNVLSNKDHHGPIKFTLTDALREEASSQEVGCFISMLSIICL